MMEEQSHACMARIEVARRQQLRMAKASGLAENPYKVSVVARKARISGRQYQAYVHQEQDAPELVLKRLADAVGLDYQGVMESIKHLEWTATGIFQSSELIETLINEEYNTCTHYFRLPAKNPFSIKEVTVSIEHPMGSPEASQCHCCMKKGFKGDWKDFALPYGAVEQLLDKTLPQMEPA